MVTFICITLYNLRNALDFVNLKKFTSYIMVLTCWYLHIYLVFLSIPQATKKYKQCPPYLFLKKNMFYCIILQQYAFFPSFHFK